MIDYEIDNNNSENDNINQYQQNQGSQKTYSKFHEQNGEIDNQTQIINKDNQENQKINQKKQNQLIKKLDIHKAQAINQQGLIKQKQQEKLKENEKKSLKNQGEIEDFEAEIDNQNDYDEFYSSENDESRHRNLTTNIKKKNSYEKQYMYSQSSKTYRGLISVKDFVQKYKHQDFKLLPSDKPELRPNIHSYMLKNSEKLKEKYGDFRDEIEKRFKASSANKDFQFPRTNFDFYDNDSDSSSHNTSFDSMLGVKEYKLENQNNFKLSTRYKRQMRLQREQNLNQENFQKLQQNSMEKAQNEEDVTQRDQINNNSILQNQQERRNRHQQIKKEDLKLINQDIFKSKAKEREKEEFDKLKEQDIVAKKDFILSKNSNSKNKHRKPQIHEAVEQNQNQNDQDNFQKQNNLILIQDNQLENNNSNTKQQEQVQQNNQLKDLIFQQSEQKQDYNSVGINEIKENYQKKEIQQQIQSQISIQRSLLKESNKYSKLSQQSDLNKKKIYPNNLDSQLQQQTFQSENESEDYIEASVLTGTKNYQQKNGDQQVNCNNKNFQSYNIGKSHRRHGNSKSLYVKQGSNNISQNHKQSQKKGQGLKLHIDKNSHNHEPEEEVVNSKQYYKNSNSQNSKQFNDYSYSGISWSVSTKKCSREMQFDRFQVKNPLRADQKESYFSIFDGHNSDQVSSYLQENLHQLIIQNQKYLSTHDKDQAFKEIFQQMDNDIMGINDLHGGSTALVAIIKQDTLYIVNVGDSQAKMFKTDKSLKAMNRRHIVGDESEKNMLQNKGAVIFDRGNIERINGKLAVSRSFGDKEYKQFISSVPETTTFKLENDDKYLLLASDGLWDCMKDEEVVKLINKFEQDQDLQCKNDNNQKLSLSRYLLDQASDMAGSLTKKDNMTLVIIDIQMLIQEQQNFNIIDKTANNDYSNVIDNQENRQSLSNFDFPQPQNKNNKIQTEIENINKFSQMEIESSGKISMDNINNNQQNNNFCFNNNGSIDSPNKNINNNQNKNINLNINDSIKQNLNSDNGIQEYNQESSKNQSNYQNQDNIHCFQNNKYIDPAIKKINLSQNQENEILSVSKEKSKGNFSFGEGFMTNSNGSENDQNQKQQQQQQDKTKIQEFNTINIQNNISQYNNLNSCNSKSKNNFNFSPVNSNNGENNENIQNQGTSKPKSYFYIETNKFEEEDEDRL